MVAGKVVPVLLSWLRKSVDYGVPLASQAYLVVLLDLRPVFCEESHVARALDAGGTLRSDRVAERNGIKIWIIENVMVRQGEAVDIQLVVHDVSHRLLVRANQCELNDLGVSMPRLPDKVGRAGNGRVHAPEDDTEPFGHNLHDLGVEHDHVYVTEGDGGRRIDDLLEQPPIDV